MQIAWAFLLPLLLPGSLSIGFNTVYRLKTLQGFILTGSNTASSPSRTKNQRNCVDFSLHITANESLFLVLLLSYSLSLMK